MNATRLLQDPDAVVALAKRLAKCRKIAELSTEGHDEPSTLAHSLADLEESFETFRSELLPRLVTGGQDTQRDLETLLDIGEELRHALYHIEDPRFFAYLRPPSPEDGPVG